MNDSGKDIKIYGTLVNYTVDSDISDSVHNDVLAYAKQLYDDQFFAGQKTIQNYQDIINKRLTAISYVDDGHGNGCTIIENRPGTGENPYTLVVNGKTNLNGDTVIKNLNVTGNISGIALDDLDDVTTTGTGNTPDTGEVLKYNGTIWVPAKVALGDLEGLGSANEGQVLKYIEGQWKPGDDNHNVEHLNDIGDVNAPSPADGAILVYNATSGKWVPSADSLDDLMRRISELEKLWKKTTANNVTYLEPYNAQTPVHGYGFYDQAISVA